MRVVKSHFGDVKHRPFRFRCLLIAIPEMVGWSSHQTFHQPSFSVNTRSGSVSLTEFYAVVEVPVGGHLGMGQHPLLPYLGTCNQYSTAIFWKPITILSPYYHHIITILLPYYYHIITILLPYYHHIITILSPYYHHIWGNKHPFTSF